MKPSSIPPRTRAELASPAAPGSRHAQMVKIAIPLIGNGLSPEAVFAELRGRYDRTVTDAEIRGVVRWALAKNPQPSISRNRFYPTAPPLPPRPVTRESATAAFGRFLKGFHCGEVDLWDASPWSPLEDRALDALLVFAGLFHGDDLANHYR